MAEKPSRLCKIDAPCKINLHLAVKHRRHDGFHALESLYALLALSDTLIVEFSGKEGECALFMDWEGAGGTPSGAPDCVSDGATGAAISAQLIKQEDNLVYKAASLFRERTGVMNAMSIHLTKCLPIGAGLGGGSSDAVSTLLALNFLAGTSLSRDELLEMAAFLGSDLPFFLGGGLAFVSGRGELVEPLSYPAFFKDLLVVLVMPPFSSDTATAYRRLDQARERLAQGKAGGKEAGIEHPALSKEDLMRFLIEDPANWPFYNDFLPVFLDDKNADIYRSILDSLQKLGAVFTGLSGSGSCCFGIFCSKKAAETAEKEFLDRGNYARMTFFLAQRANPVLK